MATGRDYRARPVLLKRIGTQCQSKRVFAQKMQAKFVSGEKFGLPSPRSSEISQWFYAIIATALVLAFSISDAVAGEKQAAMVIDANTGRVLYSKSGDEERYPASLTKIMTLYMVFELLEQGRLTPNTKIRISSQAAAQPPSRIGLKVGKTIRLRDAMKALVTKSANDIAVALAEHIAGSEAKFARLMTAKAKAIGMIRTRFKNASGLPNNDQVTTARDMLTLAMRIQEQFPKHYEIFKTRKFYYNGKRYKNHNTLLGRVKGVDGIKTGYIRKSGFNLVTSVRTGGKHVVAVVFGGKTAKARNREMQALIKRLLPIASTRRTRPVLIARPRKVKPPTNIVAPTRRPAHRPNTQIVATPIEVGRADKNKTQPTLKPSFAVAKVRPINIGDLTKPANTRPQQQPAPTNWPQGATNDTYTVAGIDPTPRPSRTNVRPLPSAQNTAAFNAPPTSANTKKPARSPGTLQDQLARLLSKSVDEPGGTNPRLQFRHSATRPRPTNKFKSKTNQATQHNSGGPYQIQVGAYATHRDAELQLTEVTRRSNDLLRGYLPLTQEVVGRGNRKLYRARFAGFDETSATQTCRELRRRAIDCLVAREQ